MGRAEVKRFRRAAEEAAAFLKPKLDGNTKVKVVSHTDADGISSAAIMARCLYSYNVPFTVKFGRAPNEDDIAKIAEESHDLYIFLDQGSGQIDAINKYLLANQKDVLIIDHHPGQFLESPNLFCVNPHACGLNGAADVSASGATFSVVEQIDLRFRSLVVLALVGAIGDRQETPYGFSGVNDTLLKRAVDLGLVVESEGLNLARRSITPSLECLRTSTRPFMVGLSGNLAACRSLVDALGISHSSLISDLGLEVERRLSEAIISRVGAQSGKEEFRHALWGSLYAATGGDLQGTRELREQAAILDACANMKKTEIGFAAAVGDEGCRIDALAVLNTYQEQMLRTMSWLVSKLGSFKLTSSFRWIYAGDAMDSGIVGEVLSLALESALLPPEQPVVGMADASDGWVKVSARGTPKLSAGVNLGQAMSKAAAGVGGFGGGHDVSAAARIPRSRLDEFVIKLDNAMTGVG